MGGGQLASWGLTRVECPNDPKHAHNGQKLIKNALLRNNVTFFLVDFVKKGQLWPKMAKMAFLEGLRLNFFWTFGPKKKEGLAS